MKQYQILIPDIDLWNFLIIELEKCTLVQTQYKNHFNFVISDTVKNLISTQIAQWKIDADIIDISGWKSIGPGWNIDWHSDKTDNITHVLCFYNLKTSMSGGQLVVENNIFEIEDKLCILMNQDYKHKVMPIDSLCDRRCISVSLSLL